MATAVVPEFTLTECVEELYDPPLTAVTPTEVKTGSCTDTAPVGSVPDNVTVTTRVPLDVEVEIDTP